jgi:hypothetical protein
MKVRFLGIGGENMEENYLSHFTTVILQEDGAINKFPFSFTHSITQIEKSKAIPVTGLGGL